MFMTYTKAQAIKAMRAAFDNDFPTEDFRNILVSLEFPVAKTDYPSIWMDFDPGTELRIVGIGHEEYDDSPAIGFNTLYRWRFRGYLTFTVVALSSLERDRLFDAVIRVMAFSKANEVGAFRTVLEQGDLIAMNADFDEVELRGFSASAGTPWGTDEMMYEGTVAMEVSGEFINTDSTVILPVSNIELINWETGWSSDPTTGVWQHEL